MRPSENLKRDRYNINVSHTENIHTPPKTNAWNPKIGGLLVDVSPFFLLGVFSGSSRQFSGVRHRHVFFRCVLVTCFSGSPYVEMLIGLGLLDVWRWRETSVILIGG